MINPIMRVRQKLKKGVLREIFPLRLYSNKPYPFLLNLIPFIFAYGNFCLFIERIRNFFTSKFTFKFWLALITTQIKPFLPK